MYLSRVEIDRFNRKTIMDLTHLGTYHGWVESCFNEDKTNRSRKLWRVDKVDSREFLLILSEEKPIIDILEKYGVKGTADSKRYDRLLDSVESGMIAKFKIELNAVKSIRNDSKDSKRGALRPINFDESYDFFNERTLKNGFEVIGDPFITDKSVKKMKKKSEGVSVSLNSITYEGLLRVTDEDKFKRALIEGIGKKKAYGFGLLSIIPIQSE